MSTAVIIARFQTPYLHEGHRQLIDTVKAEYARLVILLGVSAVKGSRRNPFDYHTREKMIKKAYPEVVVLPVSDHPSDKMWSTNIDNLLKSIFPGETFSLFGSRDSFIPYYSGKLKTIELSDHGDYNATDLRNQYADKVFDSEDFRAGILYAYYNQYTKVYPTVDVALFKNDKTELLLGKKSNSSKWRLIGGFADPEDESFATAARRELTEECGEIKASEMTYETSAQIDDWRYRKEADKIITTLFSCDYISGEPHANDDIVELNWFAVSNLQRMIADGDITNEHIHLITFLVDRYLKN